MRRAVVERATDGAALLAVDIADSWWTRLRGLIGRPPPEPGAGLFFPGTNSIHMLFMRYPIDCVFVRPLKDGNGVHEVVAIRQDLKPWTGVVWFVRRARGAIELAAGGAAQAGIRVGDLLRLG
jgi:uncharacterized membrane protein (UPF0127 family)